MLIFLYGEDSFRISKKLERIIGEYKGRTRGLDFSVFDALVGSGADFFFNLRQNSLFGEKKLFVVKNPISNKDFKELLIPKIKEIAQSDHNIVFCQQGKVLKADRLLKSFIKYAQVQEFVPLEGVQLNAWVGNRFKELGNPVNLQVAQVLAARVGNDLWRAENEIQKLAHFITGRSIAIADVENNIALAADVNIFKTIDAVAMRNKKQAIKYIKEHIGKGEHSLYLLTMIATQFRNLLLVKSSDGIGGASRLGIHPYVFGKTVSQARQFGLDELKSIYKKICQTDFDIKTGKVSFDAGLDLLIAQI